MTGHDHLDAGAVARYVDGTADADDRARTEAHLADCAECREELRVVRRIVQSSARRRWVPVVPVSIAAAAVLLVVVSTTNHRVTRSATTRDPSLTTALAPRPLAPLGAVARVDSLRWTSVTNAHRYRVTLFSDMGTAVWQATTADTAVALPPADSLRLVANTEYYWRLKAETDYGRWVESELATFTLTSTRAR